jgi:hypothetical protein
MTAAVRLIPAPIGPDLASELDGYRGRWVAIVDGHVYVAGTSAVEVAGATPPALDPIIFRVPKNALAAFLGIGQEVAS